MKEMTDSSAIQFIRMRIIENMTPTAHRTDPPVVATRRGFAFFIALSVCGLTGCMTDIEFREQADQVAHDIIKEKQPQAIGREEPFTISTAEDTLRRRLIELQGLQTSHKASLGSDQLEPIEHWPDDDYLKTSKTDEPPIKPWKGPEPLKLTLLEALQVAARNSREYQSQKESVFRTALSLDLERDAFRTSLAGMVGNTLSFSGAGPGDTTGITTTPEVDATKRFENGLTVAGGIMVDLVQLLNRSGSSSLGILADVTVTLPLLAGSGRHIVAEPLTQAERDMVYALWQFERFKRSFVVGIASDYLSVVQQEDRVRNAENNYRSLIDSFQRTRARAEEGRVTEIDVDRSKQEVLNARNNWINAREARQRQLDSFKITLGLPTDARIELDYDELARLATVAREALGDPNVDTSDKEYRIEEDKIVILEPTNDDAGPLELPESVLVKLALDRRLDLREDQEAVFDSQRAVVVAADALRPGLTLTASGSAGEGRSLGSASSSDGQLRPEEGTYSIGLDFDAPWDKEPERNRYRNALIDLERAVRNLQQSEDQIKLDVRNALRTLRQARESYKIQTQSVRVAERRVESAKLFLDLGRAEITDLLDAEEDLINAQNDLTSALVDYRIAELELQRDAGVLIVNERGLWREYRDASNGQADPDRG